MPNNSEATTPVSLRPDGHPWGYGCGDEKTDKYVPDGFFGANFLPACRTHDKCYENPGGNKKSCDTQLGDNIGLACDKALKKIPGFEENLNNCYIAAGVYQLAVEKFGDDAFKAAQKETVTSEVNNGK